MIETAVGVALGAVLAFFIYVAVASVQRLAHQRWQQEQRHKKLWGRITGDCKP